MKLQSVCWNLRSGSYLRCFLSYWATG